MKIAMLLLFFEPEVTADVHLRSDLCRDLASYGFEVTVITGIPCKGIDEKTRIEYMDRSQEKLAPNLIVKRVGLRSREKSSLAFRGLRYLYQSYIFYLAAKREKAEGYFIASSPPFLGIAGAFLSRQAPTVYNLQDIFPDSLINTGKYSEANILVKLLRKLEQFIYRRNSHILTVSEDFKRILLGRGVPENKISVVYNWIDEAVVVPIERKDNLLIERYRIGADKFILTHCGNIGYSQNLEMIVDIASELEGSIPDIEFVFIGDGAWKTNVEEYIKDKGVGNVRLLPFQPYEDIAHVMSLGDISLVCSKNNVGTSSFPSKTWSIMSAGRPVVASFDLDSELCTIINKADAGRCSDAEDKEALKANILELYYDRQKSTCLGSNGRQFIENNLTRNSATKKYFTILSKVMQKGI